MKVLAWVAGAILVLVAVAAVFVWFVFPRPQAWELYCNLGWPSPADWCSQVAVPTAGAQEAEQIQPTELVPTPDMPPPVNPEEELVISSEQRNTMIAELIRQNGELNRENGLMQGQLDAQQGQLNQQTGQLADLTNRLVASETRTADLATEVSSLSARLASNRPVTQTVVAQGLHRVLDAAGGRLAGDPTVEFIKQLTEGSPTQAAQFIVKVDGVEWYAHCTQFGVQPPGFYVRHPWGWRLGSAVVFANENGTQVQVLWLDQPVNQVTATATSTAGPSPTPVSATATASNTPKPSATALPSDTPRPTFTALPTDTEQPGQPTNTPRPTYTPPATYTPRPSYTPVPTDTEQPTFTPAPTDTVQPSNTPRPTHTALPTSTMRPSNTPLPTDTVQPGEDTPTPRPTYTPQPTYTPRPTHTPWPSSTALPTSTPRPTDTGVPTPGPSPTNTPTNRPGPSATPTDDPYPPPRSPTPTSTMVGPTPTDTEEPYPPPATPTRTSTPRVHPCDVDPHSIECLCECAVRPGHPKCPTPTPTPTPEICPTCEPTTPTPTRTPVVPTNTPVNTEVPPSPTPVKDCIPVWPRTQAEAVAIFGGVFGMWRLGASADGTKWVNAEQVGLPRNPIRTNGCVTEGFVGDPHQFVAWEYEVWPYLQRTIALYPSTPSFGLTIHNSNLLSEAEDLWCIGWNRVKNKPGWHMDPALGFTTPTSCNGIPVPTPTRSAVQSVRIQRLRVQPVSTAASVVVIQQQYVAPPIAVPPPPAEAPPVTIVEPQSTRHHGSFTKDQWVLCFNCWVDEAGNGNNDWAAAAENGCLVHNYNGEGDHIVLSASEGASMPKDRHCWGLAW